MNQHLRHIGPAPRPAAEGGSVDTSFLGAGDPGAIEAQLAGLTGEPPVQIRGRRRAAVAAAGVAEAALIDAYRHRGFLRADLDPLRAAPLPDVPELQPDRYGLDPRSVAALVARLEQTWCGPIGWEIGHIHDGRQRAWLSDQADAWPRETPVPEARQGILAALARAATFETALAQRLPGAKLFGLGGAESFNVLLEAAIVRSVAHGLAEVVIGGMHRGRFNTLANISGKPLTPLVAEIVGKPAVPEGMAVSSDVSYHLGYSGEREIAGRRVKFSVSAHPSHLQLVPIISQGRARAKQAARGGDGKNAVLPLLLHTDASFAGQGLVAEMFQLARLAPFDLGGTIHVVINNQLGFTTVPGEGRSARHPTDIAKLVEAPVLHVNGDDPEAVAAVARIAADWRAAFQRDIVIDLVCYRRPGHNEIDEPRFTQPAMYRAIDARPPVHELYAARLAADGVATDVLARESARMTEAIRDAIEAVKSFKVNRADWLEGAWAGVRAGTESEMLASPETGVPLDRLRRLGHTMTTPPDGFALDPKIARFLAERWRSFETGAGLGWATGEALALASLASEGVPVRFGGQDSVRGAFTQRHIELHDQASGARHNVLSGIAPTGVALELHNTPLIEHAVLCYEYGISLADPRRLVVWEAQFGEFLNVAQPVFDQCIACGEDRWLRASGLVILLPHGLDGGGPDHSTGRPERLLAAAAGANLVIANASTPANFFHLLRRQMAWAFRKPLVVLTPKALLRHKACVSALADFGPGTAFQTVIADADVAKARRVVLCTGKVYYELAEARARRKLESEIALVRIEQLHPFPEEALRAALGRHPGAEVVWCEEEPQNMGYFTHLDRRLEQVAGRRVRRAGRPAVATPSVGVKYWLEAEAAAVMAAALD